MNQVTSMMTVAALSLGGMALIGCDEEPQGPFEQAGEELDRAVEEGGEALERAGEELEGAAEDAEQP